eukprot:CAMPEP_0170495510 /NCGR_PEP_ID=MMETSP0208-20121228/16722_1 /TAXON_ID=197538 /ORGANISM="Strombidium inclinatum, Strain S3" /LENGTH=97 /DNA_ID=CAMNT_0010771771 /DNA_START=85 /DNA_END=375 /DNA_ORIENTATION=-
MKEDSTTEKDRVCGPIPWQTEQRYSISQTETNPSSLPSSTQTTPSCSPTTNLEESSVSIERRKDSETTSGRMRKRMDGPMGSSEMDASLKDSGKKTD